MTRRAPKVIPSTAASVPWNDDCPDLCALPYGLDAVLWACKETHQPMSTGDRKALADWLRRELARVDLEVIRPVDRQYVALDRRVMEAILWAVVGPDKEAP